MPFIEIMMLEGRSDADKRRLLEAVTLATHQALDLPLSGIRTWIKEVQRDSFLAGEAVGVEAPTPSAHAPVGEG